MKRFMKFALMISLISFVTLFIAENDNIKTISKALFSVFFITFIISSIIKVNEETKKDKITALEKAKKITKDNNFPTDTLVISYNNKKALSISEELSSILTVDLTTNNVRKVKFVDIIEAKVKQNSSTVTRTSRGSQLGGAIVGGVLAGGVGAVIGGLSGEKTSNEAIKKLSLEIVINNLKDPIFEIEFYDSVGELKVDSDKYKAIASDLNKWYRMFTVILYQNKQETI